MATSALRPFCLCGFSTGICACIISNSSRRLTDNALEAFALLIAESKPEDKDTMVTLVVNLINQEN